MRPGKLRQSSILRWCAALCVMAFTLGTGACRQRATVEPGYHEYAYVTNGESNSVSVLDLLQLRNVKTIPVGTNPTGVAASPTRNEIYVANADSNNISIIDAERNVVVATIGVHRAPYFVSVSSDGKRAYVANSGSANVSVIDLDKRVVIATIRSRRRARPRQGLARWKAGCRQQSREQHRFPSSTQQKLAVRSTVPVCQQPQDLVILPDSSKVFVACPASNQLASIDLKSDRVLTAARRGQDADAAGAEA